MHNFLYILLFYKLFLKRGSGNSPVYVLISYERICWPPKVFLKDYFWLHFCSATVYVLLNSSSSCIIYHSLTGTLFLEK